MAKRKYKYYKLKSCRVYTINEICEILNLHKRTVQAWVKEGLKVKNRGGKPLLIEGMDLKEFLKERSDGQRTKLKKDEFYCMKCRKAVKAKEDIVQIEIKDKVLGQKNRQIFLRAKCEFCSNKILRLSSSKNIISLGLYNNIYGY